MHDVKCIGWAKYGNSRLLRAPSLLMLTKSEVADTQQIGLRAARQAILGHSNCIRRLAARGEFEILPDAPENVAAGDSAGIAFVNCRSERCQFQFVLPLLALQIPQPGAHYLACVFVAPTLDLGGYEAVKFGSQIDVASRHGGPPIPDKNGYLRIMIA
jgi:hypothetical protein